MDVPSSEVIPNMKLFNDAEKILDVAKEDTEDKHSNIPRLKPINRQQILLHPIDIENLVAEDHEVRAIWEFVGRLDLSQYYETIGAIEGEAGRSPWDPQLLISIWIYSYGKGISSAREISRLCEYDPVYQWLTGMEVINHHTLSDFRIKYHEALNNLFTETLGVLSSEGLVTLERVMHDGTKIKAYASADTFRSEKRIDAYLKLAEEQVQIMEEMSDKEISPRVHKAKERAIREKKEKLELALEELKKVRANKNNKDKEKARVSITDPQSRIMKQSDGGYAPSYNVQISADDKEKIVVGVQVSQSGSDYGELVPSCEKIEENMGSVPKQLVVDGGFVSRENIIAMDERKVDLIGNLEEGKSQSDGQFNKRGIDPAFRPNNFIYHDCSNTYTCPAGKILSYEGKEERIGKINYKYRISWNDCEVCNSKNKCCPMNEKKGRALIRSEDASAITAFREKMQTEEAKSIYKRRGEVAEFPNAWIKTKIGLSQFRLQGLIKVTIEALWACLTYNIKQWIRIRWRQQWVECGN
jgi:transposase